MEMTLDPVLTASIRIRFSGTDSADTFHLVPRECVRLNAEWLEYLHGRGVCGGAYASEEAEHPVMIAFNFNNIAYVEPGKQY